MIRIQKEDFSIDQEIKSLLADNQRTGAVVTMTGIVREFTAHQHVQAMELEHYPGMTEKELEKIATTAMTRFSLQAVRVVHRVGRLTAGENIVLVIAAAAHRGHAFDGCRFIIDYLKIRATFWKKEITPQGEKWIDSCPGCEAAASQWEELRQLPHTHASQPNKPAHGGHHHSHHSHPLEINWLGLRTGILTLSDSRNLHSDSSGDILEKLAKEAGAEVVARHLLPDDRAQIADLLCHWADDMGLDVILTTGGTGPSPRDVTPEATQDVCDRILPGIAELIRMEGLKQVRSAVLTRGITALRATTLVINLPGSRHGASQSFTAMADLVPHILSMARGGGH
ncbi:MAG: molybdenum cofactor biosynthesis protein MoaE [Magnetococcus sp. DMHC-6]